MEKEGAEVPWAARKRTLPFAKASGVRSVTPTEDFQEAEGETRLESREPV